MNSTRSSGGTARLRLFGRFAVFTEGGLEVTLSSRRGRALLAFLHLSPDHEDSRERLCGLLWSDRGEVQARASLRQCLLELRDTLLAAGLDLLHAGRDRVGLNPGRLTSDLDDLQAALAGEDAAATTVFLAQIEQRPLLADLELPGLFEDWLAQTRPRIELLLASSVHSQLERFERMGRWSDLRSVADAFLGRDAIDETVAAAAIRADMALGNTVSAHRRFQMLESALEKEFNTAPGVRAREALIGGAGIGVSEQSPTERPPPALPARPSIAVLPFKNLSGDPDKEYFVDAITEDIIAMLSRWRWFFVIASGSSFNFKDREINPSQLGNDLGVRYLLQGGIWTIANRVRLVVKLVHATDGATVWADRFDREVTDILAIQDEIAEQVVAAIEPAILHREGAPASPKSLHDFSALDCFYRGMWHLNTVSEAGYGEAVRLFREAIERDPLLPQGHIGLARILFGGAIFGWSTTQQADLRESRDAARRAIGMDGRDACAYFACAGASLYLGDHGAALEEAHSAISLNPNFAPAQARIGQVLVFCGRPSEAIAPLERFLRLSPYDSQLAVILESLALAHYHAGNFGQAVVSAKAAMHRNHVHTSAILAASLARMGRDADAALALPQSRWGAATTQRPLAAPYANPDDLESLRQGVRLARLAGKRLDAS